MWKIRSLCTTRMSCTMKAAKKDGYEFSFSCKRAVMGVFSILGGQDTVVIGSFPVTLISYSIH